MSISRTTSPCRLTFVQEGVCRVCYRNGVNTSFIMVRYLHGWITCDDPVCIESVRKGAFMHILEEIPLRFIQVTYPIQFLRSDGREWSGVLVDRVLVWDGNAYHVRVGFNSTETSNTSTHNATKDVTLDTLYIHNPTVYALIIGCTNFFLNDRIVIGFGDMNIDCKNRLLAGPREYYNRIIDSDVLIPDLAQYVASYLFGIDAHFFV